MAFFDIGINVIINGIDVANSQINGLKSSLATIPAAAQSTSNAVNNMNNSFRQTSVAAGQAVGAEQNIANAMRSMFPVIESNKTGMQQFGLTISNMVPPMNQAAAATEKFSATLNQIKSVNLGPLQQIPTTLGQTATSMDKTTNSGNRLAEIFRGNRGLVFGFSSFFGTLTGIAFELQLVSDAQGQVAESSARLNQLTQQGLQGSQQYSQAQQALAKDQRFLEFATRNLGLAFTNLIPDVLLIVNGLLNLQSKLATTRAAEAEAAATTKIATAEFRANGIAAATSAAPLASLGVAGRAAAIGEEEAAVGARVLGISLRSLLISTGVGAALVLVGLALEPLIENFMKSHEASAAAAEGFTQVSGSTDQVGTAVGTMADNVDTANQAIIDSTKEMVDSVVKDYQRMVLETQKAVPPAQKGAITPKPAEKKDFLGNLADAGQSTLNWFGGIGQSITEGLGFKREVPRTVTSQGPSGEKPYVPLNPDAAQIQDYQFRPEDILAIQQQNVARAKEFNQGIIAQYTQGPNAPFASFTKAGLDVPIEKIQKYIQLNKEMNENAQKGTPEAFLAYGVAAAEIQKLLDPTEELKKRTDDLKKSEDDKQKTYEASQKSMDAYNATLDKLPLILQDTGAMTKQLSEQEIERQGIIRTSAAVFVGQAEAQKLSLGVAQQVAAQGNKITSDLINQRDAIQANNVVWDHMNQVVAGTTVTLGDWILAQQKTILSSIDVTKSLTNLTYQQYLTNQGMIAGKTAAKDMLEQFIMGKAENQQFAASAQQIAQVMQITLPNGMQVTQEAFGKLLESIKETGGEGQFLADTLNERIAPAVQLLGKAINAKNWKEFKEGFKGLEFGDTSGKLVSKFKDFDNMLRKVNEDAREMNTVFQQMNLMESLGKLDSKTFVKGITEMEDKVKQIQKLQKGIDLSTIINFLEEMKNTKDPTQLEKFQKVFALISADAEDGYTSAEVRAINDAINQVDPNPIIKLEGALNGMLITTKEFKKLGPLGSIISTGVTPGQEGWASQKEMKNGKWTGRFINTPIDGKDGKISPEQQKLLTELNKDIPAAAQAAQKALANFAVQGSNSLALLAKNAKAHVTTIITYFGTTVPQVMATSTGAFLGFSVSSSNSMATLVKNLKPHVTTIMTYFGTTVVQALTAATTSFDTFMTTGSNDMATLVKNIRPHVVTLNTYFATTIPQAVDAASSAFDDLGSHANSLEGDLSSLEKQADATRKALEALNSTKGSGGGGGGGSPKQHGMHETLGSDMLILAHRGERVDIDTVGATQANAQKAKGGSGLTVINLNVTTVNELDGEVIGTTVTRKTFRKMSTR